MSKQIFLRDDFEPGSASAEIITEATANGKSVKRTYITGVFMQADRPNRNKRMYPKSVMENALKVYQKDWIDARRSFGELNHPESVIPNPERASHLNLEFKFNGSDIIGKARVMESMPMGKIVKGLLDEGIRLGVSSRGMGDLKEDRGIKVVQKNFYLTTVDVVTDPSAHGAFVDAIMENKEWFREHGLLESRDEIYRVFRIDENKALDNLQKFLKERRRITK